MRLSSSSATRSRIDSFRAQGAYECLARTIAPAVAAAAVVGAHSGRPLDAAVLFACVFAIDRAVFAPPLPYHLMPAARWTVELLAPCAAVGLAVAIGALIGSPGLAFTAMPAPLLVAWAVTIIGHRLEDWFDADRPVRIALVGDEPGAAAVADGIAAAGVRAYRVLGFVGDRGGAPNASRLPRLGDLSELREVVIRDSVDLLVLAPRGSRIELIGSVTESCLDLGVRMVDAAMLHEEALGHVPIGRIDAAWFRHLMHPAFAPSTSLKRLADVALGILLALPAAPLLAAAALAIKLDGGGPVIYRQRRCGEGGREFDLLKLRTMRPDAEAGGGALWATASDERVTRVGRLLRRTHLDEAPQLWNVLRGEMSIVGPRPERPELVAQLERQVPYYQRRGLVRPGVTGWAQVRCGYAGSEAGAAWKLCHDLYYLKRRSLVFDLLILVETVRTVVSGARLTLPPLPHDLVFGEASGAGKR